MDLKEPLVPVMRPVIPRLEQVTHHLRRVHDSGWFSNFGPAETSLRQRFASILDVPPNQVSTAANATLALAGCVAVSEHNRWSTPSFTFTASPAAVLAVGKDFEFIDISAETFWADTPSVEWGFLAVAPFGDSIVSPPVMRPTGGYILDAAASLGNTHVPESLGASSAVVFSLHATKVLGSGEGALVIHGSPEAADGFRAWTNFGFSGSRESRIVGVNAKMSEIQAAYGHAALDGWEQERAEWIAARDRVVQVGDEVGLTTFQASREHVTPYWIALFPDAGTTDLVEQVLEAHGVGTRRWWSHGCHRMPAYADVPHGPLPATEDVADRYLGLPLYRGLSEEDAERIHAALLDARDRAESW